MGYEKINKPQGELYHYTKRENLEQILKDQKIKKFKDRECWFCTSLENVLRLMELTVMQEGKKYYDVEGNLKRYPEFIPEEYVILRLTPRFQNGEWVIWNQQLPSNASEELVQLGEEFSHLKVGFRGDLKFRDPCIIEFTELVQEQREEMKYQMQI